MLKEGDVRGESLDHLGLLCAVMEEIGLVDRIDKRLPLDQSKGGKVTMGERVKAMILNGLGFIDDRLYLFPEFLETKPVERLFRAGLCAEDFNDDAIGRCLDRIYAYGCTSLFSELSFEIGTKFGLLGKTARIDTTSLSVYGSYVSKGDEREDLEEGLRITHGYSKDLRPDLKQMILNLTTTGKSSFPLWMSAHSGNASDKVVLQQAAEKIKRIREGLKLTPSFICVGDSAMYDSCVSKGGDMLWLSRVPQTHTLCKELVSKPEDDIPWEALEKGYRISPFERSYGGIKQRWLLVHSKQAMDRECVTLEKHITKEKSTWEKKLKKFSHETFKCLSDAEKGMKKFGKGLKYHRLTWRTEEVWEHSKKGRPKAGDRGALTGYTAIGTLISDEAAIEKVRRSKGRFVLATNQLDKEALSDEMMLFEYKEQIHTEAGFRFIKGDAFEVSSVFLKKTTRIEALMMIMVLCLMIYNLAQYKIREALKERKETVPNQIKKEVQNPTMAWVCRMFHGIQVIYIRRGKQVQQIVANLKAIHRQIIDYFGETARRIYDLSKVAHTAA